MQHRVKVLTVLGARPEIIRLSLIIERLDRVCDHVLVHTGQNHGTGPSDVLFDDLGLRAPDHHLGVDAIGFAGRIGQILERIEPILRAEEPDRMLVLGGSDSGLSTVVAKRLGIEVFHMEAGNRCFDDRVPQEVNRRVIDHSSDVLLPYTENGRRNLLDEGLSARRILVTGNPILEVIEHHEERIAEAAGQITELLGVTPGEYLLLSVHRQETVEVEPRLRSMAEGVLGLAETLDMPVVISISPRTRNRLEGFGIDFEGGRLVGGTTFGFFDFVALEMGAHLVLTDSGTVQEECCLFGTPVVTLGDTTERPETLECGSNILSGVEPEAISRTAAVALDGTPDWEPPEEYLRNDVSSTLIRLLLAGKEAPGPYPRF